MQSNNKGLRAAIRFEDHEQVSGFSDLGGDADTVFLHVHDGFWHFDRDRVGSELDVERPL